MLKICITGHRDLLDAKTVEDDMAVTLDYFKKMDNELIVFTALAAGADTIFAEQALKKNIPINIVLPFEEKDYKKDFTHDELKVLDSFIKKSQFEVYTKLKTGNTEERNTAYLETGKMLVDKADIVLAVWNGKEAAGVGGTGDIVEYAKQKGKQLHIIKAARLKDVKDPQQSLFHELDKRAKHYKNKRFQVAWATGIITGLLAVFSFGIGTSFPELKEHRFWLSFAEVTCFGISFISFVLYAKRWKQIFLTARRGAEYMRTILWYKHAGIPVPRLDAVDYKPGKNILDIETTILLELLEINNLDNAKRASWCLAEQQINYHQEVRVNRFSKKNKEIEVIFSIIKVMFVVTIIANLLLEGFEGKLHLNKNIPHFENLLDALRFTALILPPVYAALEGVKYFGEWKRNIAISKKTITELKTIQDQILGCNNSIEFLIIAKRLRDILELENSDWAIRYEEKEVGSKL